MTFGQELRVEWRDIDYLAVAKLDHLGDDGKPYVVDFLVYQVLYWEYDDKDGHHEVPEFPLSNGTSSNDTTTDLAEAQIFMDCSIKWDGCCNLQFPDNMHFCSRSQAVAIGTILDRLYSLMAELCEDTQGDLA